MKKIEAIIRTEKFNQVRSALDEMGIMGLTSYEVRGRGQQKGLEFTHRAGTYRVDMLPKTKLEVVVNDKDVDRLIEAICGAARTGEIGDGKIFVIPVENAIRIRTGEEGALALGDEGFHSMTSAANYARKGGS
jgi:nitrogen regulatory protein P-II 1